MDRMELKKQMESLKIDDGKKSFINSKKEIVNNMIDASAEIEQIRGLRNLIIAMEELSELQQAISKILRDKGDKLNVIEELVDVEVVMETVKNTMGITEQELDKVRYIKLKRLEDKISSTDFA